MKYYRLVVSLFFIIGSSLTYASFAPDSATASYGQGGHFNLRGYQAGLQWHWGKKWFRDYTFLLTGYWDLHVAHWETDDAPEVVNDSLYVFSLGPVLRLQTSHPIGDILTPYVEVGISPSIMTDDHLGQNDLGSRFSFRDAFGAGVMLGKRHRFVLSYHYIHYSNAGLAAPNDGIDVQDVFSVGYRWT